MDRLNLDEPRWDQSTYMGRARHFFTTTNPLNVFASPAELDKAKDIITRYRQGENLNMSTEDLWKTKQLYDSAFHPDTGEKMLLIGRMSAQVPMNMSITGCMLTFYKSTPAVIFWQWVNQSFNAAVNYTNRSGDSPIPKEQLQISYVLATAGALGTALTLNNLVKRMPPIIGRFVPFVAVAAANCINIPMMRLKEIQEGVPITDQNGNRIGHSIKAAHQGIGSVLVSRIIMAAPGMVFPPLFMNILDKRGVLRRMPWVGAPVQVALCGLFLTFATPACCAIFPQKSSIRVDQLEEEVQAQIKQLPNPPDVVYFNKGL